MKCFKIKRIKVNTMQKLCKITVKGLDLGKAIIVYNKKLYKNNAKNKI